MFLIELFHARLLDAAVVSLLILVAGTLGVLCCRQPVRRIRLIGLTLAGCLAAPCLGMMPGVPQWSLPKSQPVEHANDRPRAAVDEPANVETVLADEASDIPAELDERIESRSDSLPRAESPVTTLNNDVSYRETNLPRFPADARVSEPAAVPFDVRHVVVGAYAVGVLSMTGWWLAGIIGLLRLIRQSQPAPEFCRHILCDIAGPCGSRVQLLVSHRASQPFTFTWLRPVIVLPHVLVATENEDQRSIMADGDWRVDDASGTKSPASLPHSPSSPLRWCMAHEWSHIARHDTAVWSLAGLVRVLFFFQPPVWWLRRELRLCQDYLADAFAAGESSPESYAEFLATRALGRPVAVGLGIGAGKSDLYRRIAMLVRNSRPLETRCPRSWSAMALAFTLMLAVPAATFRLKSEAGEEQSPSAVLRVGAATSAPGRQFDSETLPGQTRGADVLPQDAGPQDVRAASRATPQDAETRNLIDAVLSRATAITSGKMELRTNQNSEDRPDAAYQTFRHVFTFSGLSWLMQHDDSETVQLNHHGRLLILSANRSAAFPGIPARELKIKAGRTIADPAFFGTSLLNAGTIPRSDLVDYLGRNAATMYISGRRRIQGQEAAILDCPVPQESAREVFHAPDTLLDGGGTIRLFVLPQRNVALARVEYLDRWETVQAWWEASEFTELKPGIHYPRIWRFQNGPLITTIELVASESVNEELPARAFVLAVPSGTRVTDERPWRIDFKDSDGQRPPRRKDSPPRSFVTRSRYPDGLPEALLRELDANVQPEAERAENTNSTPVGVSGAPTVGRTPRSAAKDAAATRTGTAAKSDPRDSLRYGGKTFAEWRDLLLTDLEPESRVKALKAIGELGANGYSTEAADAIGKALQMDEPAANQWKVFTAGCEALNRLGEAAVPEFNKLMKSDRPQVPEKAAARMHSVLRLPSALPTLLQFATIESEEVRRNCCESLSRFHLAQSEVATLLMSRINTDVSEVRSAILSGLRQAEGSTNAAIPLLLRLLEDEQSDIRSLAALTLAEVGPNDERTRMALLKVTSAIDDARVRYEVVATIASHPRNFEPNLVIALLKNVIETGNAPHGHDDVLLAVQGLAWLGPQAAPAVPVLIQILRRELPKYTPDDLRATNHPLNALKVREQAAEALAIIGPAGKEAIPALIQALNDTRDDEIESAFDDGKERLATYRRKVSAAIRKIRGE
jgi:beta-lactamase regulating signal transducer with metallopeptidase domain/HEAT repeat protein